MNPLTQTLFSASLNCALKTLVFQPGTLGIVLAIILGILLLALLIWLLSTKRLPQWARAASQSRRWARQDHKLSTELKNLARSLNQQHALLGKEAWDARLSDTAYEPAYNKLVNVNQQMVSMEMHASSLNDELAQVQKDIETIEDRYNTELAKMDENRKALQLEVNDLTAKHKTLDTSFTELSLERARVQREIKETRTSIIDIENSDAPNKSALVFPLSTKLDQLSSTLTDYASKTPAMDDELKQLEDALLQANTKMDEAATEFNRTQILKKQELSPLEDHLAKLKQSIKKKQEEIAQLDKSIPAMLEELGAHVDHARPESLRLAPLYTNIDDIQDRTRQATDKQHLLRLEMDKGDKKAVRNFWLIMIVFLAFLLGIALVLFFL